MTDLSPSQILAQPNLAPCQAACPIHQDVEGYLYLIAQGQPEEAMRLIRETNPLPAVCGHVCSAPCEVVCRRGQIDRPIAIRALKRYAAEASNFGDYTPPKTAGRRPEHIAVIGAGPAGLTAAHDLARQGYAVTLFEQAPEAGGLLRYGIMGYRLPKEVLKREVSQIEALGVTLKTEVDPQSLDPEALLREGFQAVLLAVGRPRSRPLPLPGHDLLGVHYAIPFLSAINQGSPPSLGRSVCVIGGGNGAIDVVRSARRLGGPHVTMLYRRGPDEMPAFADEVREALDEGVEIVYFASPLSIEEKNGRVGGLRCVKTRLGAPDAQGRPAPEPVPGSEFVLAADSVIISIGQVADINWLGRRGPGKSSKQTSNDPRLLLRFDPATFATSLPGVFACGEVVTGVGVAIEAMASGRIAALALHRALEAGRPVEVHDPTPRISTQLPPELLKHFSASEHRWPAHLSTQERLDSFAEVEQPYEEEQARAEAARCLLCACPKNLSNGPCGGSQEGCCEVRPEVPCTWDIAYKRLALSGQTQELTHILPLRDWSDELPSDLPRSAAGVKIESNA